MASYIDSPLYRQMLAQTMQGGPASQYPGQAIANGLAQALQAYSLKKFGEKEEAKQQAGNADLAKALLPEQFSGAGYKSAGPDIQLSDGLSMPNEIPQIADQNADKRQQLAALLNSGAVDQQSLAPLALQQMGLGQPKAPITLAKDATLLDPNTFQPLAHGASDPQPGFTLAPGQQRFDANGKPVAQVAPEVDYNKPFLPDGSPNPAYQEFALKEKATGRPVTSVNVTADRSFGSQLGENAGKILDASHAAAQGAVQTIDTANQLRQVLDSGQVTAGPGATAIQFFNQVSGGDPNKVVATRQTIQQLAKLTVAARSGLKGQGQVSDYEGKLLAKAASGDIDSMTVPEIKAIANEADRIARISIQQNQQNVQKARKAAPQNNDLVNFYEVPEPAPYAPKGGVDDLLRKYGVGK